VGGWVKPPARRAQATGGRSRGAGALASAALSDRQNRRRRRRFDARLAAIRELMMPRPLLGFTAAVLFCFFCAAAIAQTGGVEVKDAWARATPGGAENGAAYLTLLSVAGDRLTGVTSSAAKVTQLHEMTNEGGVMKMRELSAIDLPPGQPVTLKPGGAHIMMMGLDHPLRPGESIPLTLRFEKAGTREVTAAVGKVGAMGPETHSGAMQNMQKMPAR
jgi:copper(I)-binding protein